MKNAFDVLAELNEVHQKFALPKNVIYNIYKIAKINSPALQAIEMAMAHDKLMNRSHKLFQIHDAISIANPVSEIMKPYIVIQKRLDAFNDPIRKAMAPYFEISKAFHNIFDIEWFSQSYKPDIFEDVEAGTVEVEVNFEKRIEIIAPEQKPEYVKGALKFRSVLEKIISGRIDRKTLRPSEFEDLIAELMYKSGFIVHQNKRTRDGGYDILAFATGKDGSQLKYLAQCKHFINQDKKVNIQVVREFKTVISENYANQGLIFSSTSFTKDAIQATNKTENIISLKDWKNIMDWIIKVS